MDFDEHRRRFLVQLSPWLGLIVGAVALSLGLRAVAAGFAESDSIAFLVGGLDLAAGYVTARRGWTQSVDSVFVGGVIAVIILSALIVTQLYLPPSAFQELTSG